MAGSRADFCGARTAPSIARTSRPVASDIDTWMRERETGGERHEAKAFQGTMSLWRGRVRGDGSRIEAAHLLLRHVPSSHRGAHRGLGGISARCGEMDRCGRIAGALSFVGPLEPRLLPGLRQFAWRRRRRSRRRLACRRLRPAEQPGTEAQLSQQPVGAAGLVAGARCCRRASGIGVSHARQRPFELALLPSRKPRSLFM